MDLLWLFLIVLAASVAVGLLVAGLQRWADRVPHSADADDPDTVVEPIRHTEEERAALWAELAPPVEMTRDEVKAHRRALIAERQIADDVAALHRAEREMQEGLSALWAEVVRVCGQDDIDAEWAALATGELVPA